jgi:hypothetical protein
MSAAATAAGYLYASGRLRGRGAKPGEQDQPRHEHEHEHEQRPARKAPPAAPARREVRVAVYEPQEKPKRQPKIEYRTRRWRPGGESR